MSTEQKPFNYLNEFDDLANEICIDVARLRPHDQDDDGTAILQVTSEELAGIIHRHLREHPTFQDRVAEAHVALFHDDPTDLAERRDRFFEEAIETVQALDMTADAAHQLVEYTFGRAPGDARKEIGAAALTLASLCVIAGWDMMECAEADLEALRAPEKIAKVRAKRATRHGRGPLPGVSEEKVLVIEFVQPVPGHWSTDEGTKMANTYVMKDRADLAYGQKTDLELANAIFMADGNDLALIGLQTAAKERIRWLSVQLAAQMVMKP